MSLLKKMWKTNSKHKKLCEEWNVGGSQLSLGSDGSPDGGPDGSRRFLLKYVGAAPAERACSAPATAAAVAQVVTQAKAIKGTSPGKKLRRVAVTVSPKGISVEDAATSERILDVSIYRISYCSADAQHGQVFAFVAQGEGSGGSGGSGEALQCHAFLCPRRKVARSVTLTAAHSFNAAYQLWQGSQALGGAGGVKSQKRKKEDLLPPSISAQNALLIDFSEDSSATTPWVSFDEDGSCGLWGDEAGAGAGARLLRAPRAEVC